MKNYNIAIIGAGVIGSALARELSKLDATIALVDKNSDISDEVSKANSGIVHGGFDDQVNSVKSKFCASGSRLFPQLQEELNCSYRPFPSSVLALSEAELAVLDKLYERGQQNGVSGLSILSQAELHEKEPNINKNIAGALYCESSGLVSPYEYAIALAENAITNGVDLLLEHEVLDIKQEQNKFILESSLSTISCDLLINAAGLYADAVSAMLGIRDFVIHPRKGQYLIFDQDSGNIINSIIFQVPTKAGKGVLVTPTYHNNLLIGPDSYDHKDKRDVSTDRQSLEEILRKAKKVIPNLNMRAIRSFAGNRPISSTGDFIIRRNPTLANFFEVAGIFSPGLTCSYAIAQYIHKEIRSSYNYKLKSDFKPTRKSIIPSSLGKQRLAKAELKRRLKLDSGNLARIVCRCEEVSEESICAALDRNIPINSTDAIKRRTRAGMGRCQGAFCQSRVSELVARHSGQEPASISKHGNTPEPKKVTQKEIKEFYQPKRKQINL